MRTSTKIISLPLAFCALMWSQTGSLTVSPEVENYVMRSPTIYPTWRYMPPEKRIITVNAAPGEAWTASLSGPLTNACRYFETCIRLTEEFGTQPVSAGIGPRRIAVSWYNNQPPYLDAGIYNGTVTVRPAPGGTPQTVALNLEVRDGASLPATAEAKATSLFESACEVPDQVLSYSLAVRCDVINQAPFVDPQLTQPAVGREVVDPNFGGRIKRITPAGCFTEYGTTTAFSADSNYVLTSCGVYRLSDAALIQGPHVDISYSFMSALDDRAIIYMSGSRLRYYNFVTESDTVLGEYGRAPYGFTTLYAGGTAGSSEDDWITFYDYNTGPYPKICAVDTVALRTQGAPGPGNTYCAVYQGVQPVTAIDWASVSEVDRPTGKRYVYVSALPISFVLSVGEPGSGRLNPEYIVPEWPGWPANNDDGICTPGELCYNAGHFTHASLFRDRDGQVNLFAKFEDVLFNRNYVSTYRLNAGTRVLRLQEEGGGQRMLGRMEPDYQPGCSSRIGGCTVAAVEILPGRRFASRVTAATAGQDRTLLTMSGFPGWPRGSVQSVRVQNGTGNWSCLNGGWTATVVSDTQVEIPAICSATGTGSIATVMLGDAKQPLSGTLKDNSGQLQIWKPERQIHRVAMHRSVEWNDVPGTGINAYYSTPRASLSRDGRYIAFNSNWGSLDFDGVSVYVAETGLGNPNNKILLKEVTPGQTGAAVSYDLPNGSACTFEVSADSTFQSPVETFTDPAGTTSRQTGLGRLTPLTPDHNYWLRLQCGLEVESATFRTLPVSDLVSGAFFTNLGAVDNPSYVNAALEYRAAGATQFTRTALLACSAGCRIAWPGIRGGISEYRVLYLDSSGTVVYTGPLYTTRHPL